MLSIGLMSGTSMDGIDAALLETDGSPAWVNPLGELSTSYAPEFKILLKAAEYAVKTHNGKLKAASAFYPEAIQTYLKQEFKLSESEFLKTQKELFKYLYGAIEFTDAISLNDVIVHSTVLHGNLVKQLLAHTQYQPDQIDVIGYHGQALFHAPQHQISIVVGEGQRLADFTGISVVNDFRSRDIAEGGQGAPFAPIYHHALAVRDKKIPMAVVNCGGIANISVISSIDEVDLIGFDTGPGNGLIDRLMRQRSQGQSTMDADGRYGLKGKIHEAIIKLLYERSIIKNGENYFLIPPSKSLDINDLQLIPELDRLSIEDACATLEAFTADTIVRSLEWLHAPLPQYWVLAGGGWRNPVIRREFQQRLVRVNPQCEVHTADEIGWSNQAMEAQIFAYLAVRSLQNKPLSFPGTTRVSKPLSGGTHYFPKK